MMDSDQLLMWGIRRLRVTLHGAVQGVGFRPFVHRLAKEMSMNGWVMNSSAGVFIEVEAPQARLEAFLEALRREKPPRAFIQSLEHSYLDPVGYRTFEIRESDADGRKAALILPDIATCPDCLREIFDPSDRRYLYPFTNCTNCGPRYTIIESLPYDRANTSMKMFEMCPQCRHEYEHPEDRRFHAQPNACPKCGPVVELWDTTGATLARHHAAIERAAEVIREGGIVAIKGVGGFHLIVDARNEAAVRELRRRKHREEKPFALMYRDRVAVEKVCHVSPMEARLLESPEAPIVLLRRREPAASGNGVPAASVAPNNPCLGIMLPYSPLHHILMRELGFPIVATSGNLSDEPICIDEQEALKRLHGIADVFLVHNRPIVRHTDDSIVRVVAGREMVLRRARGFAPLPIPLAERLCADTGELLAVGAHLKNTVALVSGRNAFISQHIGDLETLEAHEAFERVVGDLQNMYNCRPTLVACDLHPDYLSTRYARRVSDAPHAVQHHVAHVASCMAENDLDGNVLGVSWDGTGYGTDGTVWGGEFFVVRDGVFRHVAHFRHFRLPGGDAAIKEPRRTALGLLYEVMGEEMFERTDIASVAAFTSAERAVLRQTLKRQTNSPCTSSVGRLFDAVASIIGLRQFVQFEGQAAMELEFALAETSGDAYPLNICHENTDDGRMLVIDWEPMIRAVLDDVRTGTSRSLIAARFHNALVESMVAVAAKVNEQRVVLSGGCFQNRYLTERAVESLRQSGFRPYWHQRVPPNDGGIALGQAYAALLELCSAKRPDRCVQAITGGVQ
ncbi:MAG TPA: carbamoyltransferase HypF [Bacteroidota bacterium]|nr:carbamoyltransferase HypF [Bacteroidota bacterium]